jgi:flagellar hook-associated protein 1 FlgK
VNAGDNGFGGGSLVQLEFLDASGAVIGSTVDFPSSAGAPNDRVSYSGTVPSGAAFVRFKMNGTTFNDNSLSNNLGHFKISVIQGSESDATTNFNNKIANIVGEFGTKGNIAISKLENIKSLHDSLDNRRQSVMGVSLEEEAADLIRFQNAYAANANVMRVMSEVLQTLVGIL